MEACDEIKADQQANHTYTTESYENLMEKCESGQETLDCLSQALQNHTDAECANPDEQKDDIEDAIEELEVVPPTDCTTNPNIEGCLPPPPCATNPNAPGCRTPDPDPDCTANPRTQGCLNPNPDPNNRNNPTPPNTGTFTINVLGKTYVVPTIPFVLLAIATIATIIGICLIIKYRRINRSKDSNATRNHSESDSKGILYQAVSTLSIVAVFGILVFTLAHTGAESIADTGSAVSANDEPATSIVSIPTTIINIDKKHESTDPIVKTATITTTVTTANETGYTLSAKLGSDQDTIDATGAGITAELNTENLTATAVEIYSSNDDTSPDVQNHALAINTPISITLGVYQLYVVYTTEDNAPPISCRSEIRNRGRVGNMQNLTSANTASWKIGDFGIATDTRNSQDYIVCKLHDGHIWMLNNLKLGSTTSTTPLTPANTNIASNWTLPQVGATTDTVTNSPRAYGPVPGSTDNIADSTFYGYLYNWCAATAGGTASGGSNTCTANTTLPSNPTGDICPVNWRLPIGGVYRSINSEFSQLNAKMAGFANNQDPDYEDEYDNSIYYSNFQFSGPFRGVFSGYRNGSSWRYQGSAGLWWSSSRYFDYNLDYSYSTFHLEVGSLGVYPDATNSISSNRGDGYAIRCILKY